MRPWLTPLLCAATLRSVADLSVTVGCPTCGQNRQVSRVQAWHITSPKGRSTGDCKSCSLRKKTYPGRKNPGAIKVHTPLARSLLGTRFYRVWANMRNRCENPRNQSWKNYGGRGISVSESWRSFDNFAADMHANYAPGLTLERIDNDGPYSAKNCRWATRAEQARNTRHNRMVAHNGEVLVTSEWAQRTGLNRTTIEARLNRGWSVERALTPIRGR
jgi:hypothetical protein